MNLLSLFFRPANIVGPLPNNILNGQVEDAVPVMANLNWIINQVNANAQATGLAALLAAANSFTQLQSGIAATSPANFPIASQVQNEVFNTLSSTLGTNTITARISAMALGTYTSGQVFRFIPSQTNTGAATLAIDGLAATPILAYSLPLSAGYLRANVPVEVEFDGTNFNLQAPPVAQIQNTTITQLTSTAGSQAITTRVSTLPLAAYGTGQCFTFIPASSNSAGGVTINVDGLGAKNLAANGSTALGKELVATVPVAVLFDGTQFNLLTRQPGWVLIATQAAANSASIDFTSGITSAFDEYVLTITDLIPANNAANVLFRFSQDAGITFKAGATDYTWGANRASSTPTTVNEGTTTGSAVQVGTSLNNAGTGSFVAEVKFFNPAGTAKQKMVVFDFCGVLSDGLTWRSAGGGTFNLNTAAVNAIRIIMSAGNIVSGNFALYGIRKT